MDLRSERNEIMREVGTREEIDGPDDDGKDVIRSHMQKSFPSFSLLAEKSFFVLQPKK